MWSTRLSWGQSVSETYFAVVMSRQGHWDINHSVAFSAAPGAASRKWVAECFPFKRMNRWQRDGRNFDDRSMLCCNAQSFDSGFYLAYKWATSRDLTVFTQHFYSDFSQLIENTLYTRLLVVTRDISCLLWCQNVLSVTRRIGDMKKWSLYYPQMFFG